MVNIKMGKSLYDEKELMHGNIRFVKMHTIKSHIATGSSTNESHFRQLGIRVQSLIIVTNIA